MRGWTGADVARHCPGHPELGDPRVDDAVALRGIDPDQLERESVETGRFLRRVADVEVDADARRQVTGR
jgi:hypothetical protein